VSHHGQPPDTRHRVLNNLSSPTVSLPADQAPGLGGDTSQGISTMPHPVSQSRPRQDSAQVGRDKHGRFVPSTLGPKPPISETQKIANQKASHYKKLKDSVVVIMKKIQQLRYDYFFCISGSFHLISLSVRQVQIQTYLIYLNNDFFQA
jgi:hypothetical protein